MNKFDEFKERIEAARETLVRLENEQFLLFTGLCKDLQLETRERRECLFKYMYEGNISFDELKALLG